MRLRWLFLSALAHQSPDELTDEVQRTREEARSYGLLSEQGCFQQIFS